jgi:hypothetical protein
MEQTEKEKIIKILKDRGAVNRCSRCNHPNHTLITYSFVQLVKKPGEITLGGTIVPTVLVGCDNCGLLSQHALAPLGLIESESKQKEDG